MVTPKGPRGDQPHLQNVGPLTRTVLAYERTIKRLVPTVRVPSDWEPLAPLVAVDDFERVGTYLEIQDWAQYTEMLTRWASATSRFETTVRRIAELPGLVYYEIEERHSHRDSVNTVNSMTVFAFDDHGMIKHLDVYLQQPRDRLLGGHRGPTPQPPAASGPS
jgi:hypothetical protein